MPPILTPPEIDRRHNDTHDGDNGSGRKPPARPPVDKRTGGNGDDNNWNDRGHGSRGPRDRLSQVRMGLFFALFGVAMLFIAIISAFLVTKSNGHINARNQYVRDWLPMTVPRVLALNTFILLFSSITAEAARRSMFREHDVMEEWIGLGRKTSRRATVWLAITLALGIAFLVGQLDAWRQISHRLAYLRGNQSTHFFYLFTVTHAVHLFIGISALIAALIGLQRSKRILVRQILVDATVWYWHAMGVLWLLLYALLEFAQ